jgi:hypothetical protein
MKYGWKYYFAPTPKNVSRWMIALKGVLATVATTAFVEGNETFAFYLLLGTGLLNEFGQLFGEEPQTPAP